MWLGAAGIVCMWVIRWDLFWSVESSDEVLVDFRLGLLGSLFILVSFFFRSLHCFAYGLVGGGLVDLVERACRGNSPCLARGGRGMFLASVPLSGVVHGLVALTFLDGILYDLPLGCVRRLWGFRWATILLVADLVLFCCEKAFLMSLSDDRQADVVEAFDFAYGYLDDTLGVNAINIDNKVGWGFNLVRPMPLMLVLMGFQCRFVWVIFHCRGGWLWH